MVNIVPFQPQHRDAFERLNLAWITRHWEPELKDFQVLGDPHKHIIAHGGYIAMALEDDNAVGCCALIRQDAACFELAKMAVEESVRGQGIGWALAHHVIDRARSQGAERVFLESNTVLTPAINLYRKLGFKVVTGPPSPYERANVQMELTLASQ